MSGPAIWMVLMLIVLGIWANWLYTEPLPSCDMAAFSIALIVMIGLALFALILALTRGGAK